MEVLFDERVATVVLARPKANAIDGEWVAALRKALREAHEGGARAVVLVGIGNVFSSGLHLPALSALDRPGIEQFMRSFMEMLAEMLEARMPLVAAVNGHAIAGGCIVALACDHRVMAHGDYRIGLNEIDLGIRFPPGALEVIKSVLPRQAWSEILMLARFADPEEANGLGLVHQLADPALLLQSATAIARELASKPAAAMAELRHDLNAPLAALLRAEMATSVQAFADSWFSEETRRLVTARAEQLTAGGRKG